MSLVFLYARPVDTKDRGVGTAKMYQSPTGHTRRKLRSIPHFQLFPAITTEVHVMYVLLLGCNIIGVVYLLA
jgi:hypothetical protein